MKAQFNISKKRYLLDENYSYGFYNDFSMNRQ